MPDSSAPDLTAEFIQSVFEDVRAKERVAESARKRAGMWAAVYKAEGLGHLLPQDIGASEPVGTAAGIWTVQPDSGTWPGQILAIVRSAPHGVTRGEIKAELARGPLGERLRANANGFYSGLDRLEHRTLIVRYGERFFAPSALESYKDRVARGELVDLTATADRRSASEKALAAVAESPGETAGTYAEALVASGQFPSVGAVHNVLSKLFRAEQVQRIEGKYYPLKENDPPTGDAGGGSETGAATPAENRDQRKLDLG